VETSTVCTVGSILDRYQAQCLPSLAPRTARDYVRHIGHLKARFGDRIASELKPKDFGPFIQERSGKKGEVQRVRQLAVLSAAFTQAVSFWYLIDHNVLRDVKRPKRPPRDRLIADEEFSACRAGAPLRVQLMMDLALCLGQRQGDLLNLKWSDIKNGELHVYQSKTGKRLAIELTPDVKRIFGKCWMLPNRDEYVVTRKMGGRYSSEGYRALWQRTINAYVKRGGVRFTFHDIRAMCATKCATPEIAQRLLGHSNISMTLRIYRRGTERVKALQAPITHVTMPRIVEKHSPFRSRGGDSEQPLSGTGVSV
jgi:integrase